MVQGITILVKGSSVLLKQTVLPICGENFRHSTESTDTTTKIYSFLFSQLLSYYITLLQRQY